MPAEPAGKREFPPVWPRSRRRRHVVLALALASVVLGAGAAYAATFGNFSRGPSVSPSVSRTPTDGGFRPTNIGPRFPGGGNTPDGPGSGVTSGDGATANPSAKSKTDGTKNATTALRAGFIVPRPGVINYVVDEVILTIPTSASEAALDALARRHSMTRVETQNFALIGRTMHRWRISGTGTPASMIRALAAERLVAGAQVNHFFTLSQQPQGPAGQPTEIGDPAQYVVGKLRLAEAHRLVTGDNVLVAVIDSGIDDAHPDLAGAIAAKFDALGVDERPHAHGTEMAGAIASHGKLLGVAPRAKILAVRAFGGSTGSEGTTFRILKGIEWAASENARVINMSFAGPADPALQEALAKARKKGIVLVAAAGNAGPKSPPLYPAADPNVIAVTATDTDDKVFAQANRGNHIAIAAPGVDILVPAPDANVTFTSGTSVAAAHVSGVVALMIEARPSLKPDEVRKILTTTARSIGPKGRNGEVGAGLADAVAAVTAANPRITAKPSSGDQAAR